MKVDIVVMTELGSMPYYYDIKFDDGNKLSISRFDAILLHALGNKDILPLLFDNGIINLFPITPETSISNGYIGNIIYSNAVMSKVELIRNYQQLLSIPTQNMAPICLLPDFIAQREQVSGTDTNIEEIMNFRYNTQQDNTPQQTQDNIPQQTQDNIPQQTQDNPELNINQQATSSQERTGSQQLSEQPSNIPNTVNIESQYDSCINVNRVIVNEYLGIKNNIDMGIILNYELEEILNSLLKSECSIQPIYILNESFNNSPNKDELVSLFIYDVLCYKQGIQNIVIEKQANAITNSNIKNILYSSINKFYSFESEEVKVEVVDCLVNNIGGDK